MPKGATHVLGLDIGNDSIKMVELALTRAGVRLVTEPAIRATPPGSVSGGVVVDAAAVSEVLREMFAEKRCSTRKVVVSVGGDTSVVTRVISMPRMTGKELQEAMQWELDRQTPFPVDQVIFDFAPLPPAPGAAETENMDVFLAVGQEDMINAHVQVLQGAKLTPVHIDVEPLALARAVIGLSDSGLREQTVCIIDAGATFTGIYIFRNGWPAFLRTVPTAGESLTEAIREALGTDREQAEQVKRQFADVSQMAYEGPAEAPVVAESESAVFDSLYEESVPTGEIGPERIGEELETIPATELEVEAPPPPAVPATPPTPAPAAAGLSPETQRAREIVSEAIASRVYDLVTEISRSLDFYRRQHRNETMAQIVLCGGTAHLGGLAALISGESGVPTRIANPFEYLDTEGVSPPEYLRDLGPNMAVAVGLALRDMID